MLWILSRWYRIQNNTEDRRHRKAKEWVDDTYLYKPVLNKISATHKHCVKCNFGAPLTHLNAFKVNVNSNPTVM